MYHIFLIHLSVNGHLGCFYILAIVNSAAMSYSFCPDIYLGVELLENVQIIHTTQQQKTTQLKKGQRT